MFENCGGAANSEMIFCCFIGRIELKLTLQTRNPNMYSPSQVGHFAVSDYLSASFGESFPNCLKCKTALVMACKESWPGEPDLYTFQCKRCGAVQQWNKPLSDYELEWA
jgi:hypothetical protein